MHAMLQNACDTFLRALLYSMHNSTSSVLVVLVLVLVLPLFYVDTLTCAPMFMYPLILMQAQQEGYECCKTSHQCIVDQTVAQAVDCQEIVCG